ncbi:uncharacterized protein N7500_009233 [Penicillium coprophilum]|uniref:uncharacterized protein n=1 Tax=Penicillium coprophilum TaxID=36646 RepID=UPI0023930AA6|nr:uncharacterized protein N7500_009233 [Penicillium coprophilum]KAJ5153794.1 hypothetical protein N7500_009233 [Penicillium coprophilum]
MPFPFEYEPFYMRPLLIVESILRAFYTSMVYFIIPIAVAIAIIFVIVFFSFGILAAAFGWNTGSEEMKARREKAKKEREHKQKEERSGVELSTSPLPVSSKELGDMGDLEKRLEIEIELLGEMVVSRKERLAALKKRESGGYASDLVVLEK